jgi:hypothetical protein
MTTSASTPLEVAKADGSEREKGIVIKISG